MILETFGDPPAIRLYKFNISHLVTDTPTPRDAIASKNPSTFYELKLYRTNRQTYIGTC